MSLHLPHLSPARGFTLRTLLASRASRASRTLLAIGALGSMACLHPLHAADSDPAPAAAAAAAPDPLAPARSRIYAGQFPAAVTELRRVNASGDADWNNLMGYALRKQTRPDLDGAQRHYDAALRLNPNHRGALEYAGELALMKRDVATAERHLATLSRLCSSPCEELEELRQAITKHKSGAS